MGTMTLPIASAVSLTATGKQAPQLLAVSPFEGGRNRNTFLNVDTALSGVGAAVVQIMGTNLPAGGPTPSQTDASWAVLYTLNTNSPQRQEIQLPVWVMLNVQTAGTGTLTAHLEGIQ